MASVWQYSPYKGEHLLLHLALADFANDEGTCWPSVRTLAKKSRSSEQWVRAGIRKMIDDSLIEIIEKGLGRGNVNRYQLKAIREIPESQLPLSTKGETQSLEIGNSVDSLSYIQNHHESSLSQQSETDFDSLWLAYPKKVGKGSARKAFIKAMSKPGAPKIEELIAAVEQYKTTINDPRYIAHLATWLNGERWLDEILNENSPGSSAKIQIPHSILNAQSLGASFGMIGSSETELLEHIEHLGQAEREAALDFYRRKTSR
jgi:hypothetical protein